MTRGLLLVNLGTPQAPEPGPVRAYLKEFLSDPYVIDLNPVARWALLNLVILPTRPKKSAAAYRQVWTERGSPLLFHGFDLVSEVARALEGEFEVHLAMRYGSPSIASGLAALKAKGVSELVLLPLYPQYATSSTQSTIDRVETLVKESWPEVKVSVVAPFYDAPGFLHAFAEGAREVLDRVSPDHVLFSFHGLPIRHITQLDDTGVHCLAKPDCCDQISEVNRRCYRAQSYFTARELAHRLELPPERYTVGFQSRLTSRWIEPFSDVLLVELARRGVRHLAVICPAFVADCLETLEEIGLRAKQSFLAAGGQELTLVPSLNARPSWVKTVAELARAAH